MKNFNFQEKGYMKKLYFQEKGYMKKLIFQAKGYMKKLNFQAKGYMKELNFRKRGIWHLTALLTLDPPLNTLTEYWGNVQEQMGCVCLSPAWHRTFHQPATFPQHCKPRAFTADVMGIPSGLLASWPLRVKDFSSCSCCIW